MARTLTEARAETARDIEFILGRVGEQRSTVRVSQVSEMAAEHVWAHITGLLRDRVPDDVPDDLLWVAKAAALRISKGMVDTGSLILREGSVQTEMEFRPWSGFMLTERLILNRYRQAVR